MSVEITDVRDPYDGNPVIRMSIDADEQGCLSWFTQHSSLKDCLKEPRRQTDVERQQVQQERKERVVNIKQDRATDIEPSAHESRSSRSPVVTAYKPNSPKKSSSYQENDTSTKMPITIAPDYPELINREQEYMRCLQSSPTDSSSNYRPSKGTKIDLATAIPLIDDTGPASPTSFGSHFSDMECSSSDDYAQDDFPSARQNKQNENCLSTLLRRFDDVRCNKTKEEQLNIIFLTSDFCAGIFDHRGGYLDIPDTSVHLYIPPGALPEGVLQEIYIYLNHYDGTNGTGNSNNTSPIIRCGPSGIRFQDGIFGVVLSFPSSHNNSPFSVYTKESGGDLNQGWTNLTEDSANRCFTDGDGTVHLMLNHFSDFKTEKLPEGAQSIKKGEFKLSAFGKPFEPKQDTFHLFVCMFKPSDQKEVDDEAARRLGYFPLSDANTLINIHEGEDVKLELEDLKSGWHLIYSDESNQVRELINIHEGEDVKHELEDLKNGWHLIYPDESNQVCELINIHEGEDVKLELEEELVASHLSR
ncbi:uncharacterized protein [Amphiura filiformis]|uniref:uncharacterized protein n=1 Tax=Amphiura filiformis TaxID=82378 RepID=UPI003B21D21C